MSRQETSQRVADSVAPAMYFMNIIYPQLREKAKLTALPKNRKLLFLTKNE